MRKMLKLRNYLLILTNLKTATSNCSIEEQIDNIYKEIKKVVNENCKQSTNTT